MATFIASYLLSVLSMDSNNNLRCGLQSRSLSSFDLPVIKKKKKKQPYNILFFSVMANAGKGRTNYYPRAGASAQVLCQ